MRFRLSKNKAKAFAQKIEQVHLEYRFIKTLHAIRIGCNVKWYSLAKNGVIEGTVTKSTYGGGTNWGGESRDLHFFTIQTKDGFLRVRGKNLYPYLLEHSPGETK